MHLTAKTTLRLVIICGALTACAARTQPNSLASAVAWTRQSAERRALVMQTFKLAADRLTELTRGKAPGSWAVITDADQTLLDDSNYMQWRIEHSVAYSDSNWNAFLRNNLLPAMPGATAFVKRVHELGGRLVVVTNHEEFMCERTRENFRAVELAVDEVHCKTGPSDKNERFRAVRFDAVMYLGDNIHDFPGMSQSATAGFEHFGRDWFMFPNPMYGSWE